MLAKNPCPLPRGLFDLPYNSPLYPKTHIYHPDFKFVHSDPMPFINIDEAENSPFPVNARYSDNAAAILKLASQKAAIESKGLVGTEDILWATFASSQEKSRSNAVKQVREECTSVPPCCVNKPPSLPAPFLPRPAPPPLRHSFKNEVRMDKSEECTATMVLRRMG